MSLRLIKKYMNCIINILVNIENVTTQGLSSNQKREENNLSIASWLDLKKCVFSFQIGRDYFQIVYKYLIKLL